MKAFEVLLDLGVEEVYGRKGVELSRIDLNMQKVGAADILYFKSTANKGSLRY